MTTPVDLNKDFKETPIGLLPQEWEVVYLSDVATFSEKPRNLRLSDFEAIPFFPMDVLSNQNIYTKNYVLKTPNEITSGTYVQVGDILLPKITPSFENGKQGIVDEIPLPFAYATTEVYPLHPKDDKLDRVFLFFYFKKQDVRTGIAEKMEGTTGRQRVPKIVVQKLQLPIPPLPEQHAIAEMLSAVQRDIAATESVIVAARETKRALMKHLFTYGAVPLAQAASVPLQETEIGDVPEHWEMTTVGKVFHIQLGKMLSAKSRQGISSRPYIRNANVQWGYVDVTDVSEMDFNPREMEKFRLRNKDILVCEGGEIGRTAIWKGEIQECYYQKAIHRLRPKRDDVLPEFFLYYMLLIFVVRKANIVEGARSTIPHLPVEKILMLPFVLPSLDEQTAIVSKLQSIDAKIRAESQRKAALETLFESLLQQLMTGKVRVKPMTDTDTLIARLIELESDVLYQELATPEQEEFRYIPGSIPVLVSAPHGAAQTRKGEHKDEDEYTAGFARLVAELTGAHVLYARRKSATDPNNDDNAPYKGKLKEIVQANEIKFVLDLHGVKEHREFGIALGTINGASCPGEKERLIDSLKNSGFALDSKDPLLRFVVDDQEFAGGTTNHTVTRYSKMVLNVPAAQVEINANLRIPARRADASPKDKSFQGKPAYIVQAIRAVENLVHTLAREDAPAN